MGQTVGRFRECQEKEKRLMNELYSKPGSYMLVYIFDFIDVSYIRISPLCSNPFCKWFGSGF